MANNTNETSFRRTPYIAAAIGLFLAILLSLGTLFFTYSRTEQTANRISQESSLINSSNAMLSNVNAEMLQMAAGIGQIDAHLGAGSAMLGVIFSRLDTYEAMEGHDPLALRRLSHARAYMEAYQSRINSIQQELMTARQNGGPAIASFMSSIPEMYQQELSPLSDAASSMMVVAININVADSAKKTDQNMRLMNIIAIVMGVGLILGEIAIFLIARNAKRNAEELDRKNAQFADASSKLMRSREKMEDIAVSNILTGMKNRYALEQDISERLATEQFNIAVFDMDNFRSINDMYGYDFGDEYLAQVSERLKTEFSQFAEIYNITGNEFCFVFNREVSDTQALRLVENIVSVMNSPYTIFNLTVQLTVSASTYHYLAGDCLNVNSLLVKMDNVLRNAKRSGGGQILQVVDI